MEIDLHGYHPSEICGTDVLQNLIQQTWETGESSVTFIHGHGRNRGIRPGFVHSNTGYFGLSIRRSLRQNRDLRQWIFWTTLDCSDAGCTTVKLRPNPAPSRGNIDPLPEPQWFDDRKDRHWD